MPLLELGLGRACRPAEQLVEATYKVIVEQGGNIGLVFGYPDDLKLMSSLTLFERAAVAEFVLVRADARVPYGEVVKAMAALQAAGASKLGFLTDPPTAGARAR